MRKIAEIFRVVAVIALLAVSGVCFFMPVIKEKIFSSSVESEIHAVEKRMDTEDEEERAREIERAKEYNRKLAEESKGVKDPFQTKNEEENGIQNDYDGLLCAAGDGLMGFVKIPVIGLTLPVYHGSSDEALEKGAGHLEGSSLPVGGESTHAVLTGHTGMDDAKMFTDISLLDIGDEFFLDVFGEELVYKVDQIKTVLPTEMKYLAIEHGKDYCTLVTCTPYGVNTHRLLVRGVRVEQEVSTEETKEETREVRKSVWEENFTKSVAVCAVAAIGVLIVCSTLAVLLKKKKK